jgi:hypothetical protein
MKFFHTDLSACHAGLSHQMSNFTPLHIYTLEDLKWDKTH